MDKEGCTYSTHHPKMCGKPSSWRYPAMGGGYAYLCDAHAGDGIRKHSDHRTPNGWAINPINVEWTTTRIRSENHPATDQERA